MTTDVGEVTYAGFWIRFGAAFVDGLIVSLVSTILQFAAHTTGEVIGLVLGIVYLVAFEGGPRGAALGKQLFGIQVVDRTTGLPIGYGRALIRYFGRIVSGLALLLGYLWMLRDPAGQCWHDKFADDLVVPTSMLADR